MGYLKNSYLSPKTAPTRWHLPISGEMRRLGRNLLDQQMWCWGQDISRAGGNLLLQYGFTRQRPPEGTQGSSFYALRLEPDQTLALWGFGLFYSQAPTGGLFLKRYEFKPKLTQTSELPAAAWLAAHLPACHNPHTPTEGRTASRLLVAALNWLATYEQWVGETLGFEYRQACLTSWHKKAAVRAEEMALKWQQLARSCESLTG